MVSIQEFFSTNDQTNNTKGVVHKNNIIKRSIIAHMAIKGESTLADLAKELNISIPTVTKLVEELVADNIVTDKGKIETSGGRRPNIFGIKNSAIYFAGVEVNRDNIQCVITDLQNDLITSKRYPDFELEDNDASLQKLCDYLDDFITTSGVDRSKLLGVGVALPGRTNPNAGRSYKYFTANPTPLSEIIENRLRHPVLIENDTRAKCYGEYNKGCTDEKNVIYLNLGRGVAIGIIIDGKLYYGKSGFAGEFGHIPYFDNEIICGCGKKGCLETEVSGIAIENKMVEQIKKGRTTILQDKFRERNGKVHITDIIKAAKNDDNLSIELIEEAGEKIGKSIAFLINIFNSEVVIVGGTLSNAGDYVMLPLKSAVNKYSLSLVYNDTKFRTTNLDENIGALGAAMLIRNKIIGI